MLCGCAGLCGGSASGKTTVANKIIEALDVPWVVLLSMDSFYKVTVSVFLSFVIALSGRLYVLEEMTSLCDLGAFEVRILSLQSNPPPPSPLSDFGVNELFTLQLKIWPFF